MSCLIGRSLACDVDPPCQVQLAPTGHSLPTHVCHEMAWQSVSCFATRRPYPDDGFCYDVDYPLPLGKKGLKTARTEASKRKENAAAQGQQYSPMWLPSRSLVQSEGLLGLAVPRQVRLDGRTIGWVWLLGLVEIVPPLLQAELEAAHAELGDSSISVPLGTNQMGFTRAVVIPQGEETETVQSVEYKRMTAVAARVSKLRAQQQAAREQADDSQPGTRSVVPTYDQPLYHYVAPLTQVEVFDWREQRLVLDKAEELNQWYKAHVLGTLTRAAHRPALLSIEDKRHVLATIIRNAEEEGIPRDRLALPDAADYLDEYCQHSQPCTIAGKVVCLPYSLLDGEPGELVGELDDEALRKRRINRLRQWLVDIFKHKRWAEARQQLLS